jgi:hypothetical protein
MADYSYLTASPVNYALNKHDSQQYFNEKPFKANNAANMLKHFNKKSFTDSDTGPMPIASGDDISNFGKGFFRRIWDKITGVKDNTFKKSSYADLPYSANTLLQETVAADKGLKYGDEGNDCTQSALDFSEAYVKAMNQDLHFGANTLNEKELKVGTKSDSDSQLADSKNIFDISGDGELDKYEIAAQLLLADKSKKDADGKEILPDGLITQEEAEALNQAISLNPDEVKNNLKNIIKQNLNHDYSEN